LYTLAGTSRDDHDDRNDLNDFYKGARKPFYQTFVVVVEVIAVVAFDTGSAYTIIRK
jgi:hypothetical protein